MRVLRCVAVEDQVGEDALFLLPEVLGVPPGELDGHAVSGRPLDRVEAAAAERIEAQLGHLLAEAVGYGHAGLRPPLLADREEVIGGAGQVPGDLEVVADDRPILLPAPFTVRRPVLLEPFLYVRTVLLREILADQVGGLPEKVFADVAKSFEVLPTDGERVEGKNQVDQVRRDVVADRVPVLAGLIGAEARVRRLEGYVVEVREVTALFLVAEELSNHGYGALDVLQDLVVGGDPVVLGEPGQGVDLLVEGDDPPVGVLKIEPALFAPRRHLFAHRGRGRSFDRRLLKEEDRGALNRSSPPCR